MTSGNTIAIALLSFLMSFSIGANDAANALASSYGSGALKLLWLVLLGSVFEFLGAFFCSGHVAGKLTGIIIGDLDGLDDTTIEKMMLGTSISSSIFILASSVFGMPISGTHTVVGALVGSGLATVGVSSINWNMLSLIVTGWFVAPLLSILLCGLFFVAVCSLTLDDRQRAFAKRLHWLTLFAGLASMLMCAMSIELIREDSKAPLTSSERVFLALGFVLGVLASRLGLLGLVAPMQLRVSSVMAAVFKVWTTDNFVKMLHLKCD